MKIVDFFERQQSIQVLNLEIAYLNLYKAYVSDCKESMIIAIVSTLRNNPSHINSLQKGMDDVFIEHYGANFARMNWELISLDDTKLNVEGCMTAIVDELSHVNYYKDNYTYAQKILYQQNYTFRYEDVLYQNPQGQQLKVADLLAVSKYAVSIAEAIDPSNEEYAKAGAAITAFQGIDNVLNNESEDKPVNKMLHLVTVFLSSVVKSSLIDNDAKRGATVTSIMVDLAIDFFCNK